VAHGRKLQRSQSLPEEVGKMLGGMIEHPEKFLPKNKQPKQ
jgi:hypothetical protein